jgi:hypothetical protein
MDKDGWVTQTIEVDAQLQGKKKKPQKYRYNVRTLEVIWENEEEGEPFNASEAEVQEQVVTSQGATVKVLRSNKAKSISSPLILVNSDESKPYIYNSVTGESVYGNKPTEQTVQFFTNLQEEQRLAKNAWITLVDLKTNKPYEYNRITCQSRWVSAVVVPENKDVSSNKEVEIAQQSLRRFDQIRIRKEISSMEKDYIYDRTTGESSYDNLAQFEEEDELEDELEMSSRPTRIAKAVLTEEELNFELETETEVDEEAVHETETEEEEDTAADDEEVRKLTEVRYLLEAIVPLRCIQEIQPLFSPVFPPLELFEEAFTHPSKHWRTLMLIHQALLLDENEFQRWKRSLDTQPLREIRQRWLRSLSNLIMEWKLRTKPLMKDHSELLDRLWGFVQSEPSSSAESSSSSEAQQQDLCPFRLSGGSRSSSTVVDARPLYSELSPDMRTRIFLSIATWAFEKKAGLLQSALKSELSHLGRPQILGHSFTNVLGEIPRTFYWFRYLAPFRLFASTPDLQFHQLSHDLESFERVIRTIIDEEVQHMTQQRANTNLPTNSENEMTIKKLVQNLKIALYIAKGGGSLNLPTTATTATMSTNGAHAPLQTSTSTTNTHSQAPQPQRISLFQPVGNGGGGGRSAFSNGTRASAEYFLPPSLRHPPPQQQIVPPPSSQQPSSFLRWKLEMDKQQQRQHNQIPFGTVVPSPPPPYPRAPRPPPASFQQQIPPPRLNWNHPPPHPTTTPSHQHHRYDSTSPASDVSSQHNPFSEQNLFQLVTSANAAVGRTLVSPSLLDHNNTSPRYAMPLDSSPTLLPKEMNNVSHEQAKEEEVLATPFSQSAIEEVLPDNNSQAGNAQITPKDSSSSSLSSSANKFPHTWTDAQANSSSSSISNNNNNNNNASETPSAIVAPVEVESESKDVAATPFRMQEETPPQQQQGDEEQSLKSNSAQELLLNNAAQLDSLSSSASAGKPTTSTFLAPSSIIRKVLSRSAAAQVQTSESSSQDEEEEQETKTDEQQQQQQQWHPADTKLHLFPPPTPTTTTFKPIIPQGDEDKVLFTQAPDDEDEDEEEEPNKRQKIMFDETKKDVVIQPQQSLVETWKNLPVFTQQPQQQ